MTSMCGRLNHLPHPFGGLPVSRDVLDCLKRLTSYPIEMEADYVLASPELLTNPKATDYLINELRAMKFHEKQIPKVVRLLKNIISSAPGQLLTAKKMPVAQAQKKLADAGFTFIICRMGNKSPPMAISIQTKLGQICLHMDIPDLNIMSDVLNWGIPYE